MNPGQVIGAAIALFNERRFEQALETIGFLLQQADPSVDALNLAAACSLALQQPAEAERYWRLALAREPGHAASWNNLGILYQQHGRAPDAESAYRRAIALAPDYVDAHYNLGLLLQGHGNLEAAAACQRQVLALRPGHAGASANLGLVLEQLGQPDEAQRRFGDAAALDPLDAESPRRRADLLIRLGRRTEALACYQAVLVLRPDDAGMHNNAAVLQAGLGRTDAAEQGYRRALALRPDHADAWHNLGLLYMQGARHAEALDALRQCLALRPQDAHILNSLGNLYQHMGRDSEAEASYRDALASSPRCARTLNNLGTLLQRQGEGARAGQAYRQAIVADPDYPEPRWNLGFLLLAQGHLAEGWPWMEARYHPRLARPIAVAPRLGFPQWQGQDLAGRSIVVWPEQGFGDQLQFVRYLPLLKAAGARHVTLVCHDPLAPLMRSAAGADAVVAASEVGARLQAHDFWVFMLSLPMHFGTTLETIPAALPYLAADPARLAQWRDCLEREAGPGKLRVGLAWRGFGGHVNDAHRSLPGLDCLAPLWSVPGLSFVSLQRGMDGDAARGQPEASALPLLDLGSRIGDFGDTAAIVAQLDMVVCVDTALAHVAGALGKPCRVLLPAVHPDWRWLQGRSDSPWYPGALTLYRQGRPGDWHASVAAMATDLMAWARTRAGA